MTGGFLLSVAVRIARTWNLQMIWNTHGAGESGGPPSSHITAAVKQNARTWGFVFSFCTHSGRNTWGYRNQTTVKEEINRPGCAYLWAVECAVIDFPGGGLTVYALGSDWSGRSSRPSPGSSRGEDVRERTVRPRLWSRWGNVHTELIFHTLLEESIQPNFKIRKKLFYILHFFFFLTVKQTFT